MGFWQLSRARRALFSKKKDLLGATLARRSSNLFIEPLEERLLFSIAPTLVSVISNIPTDGASLSTDPNHPTAFTQAPQQLILNFDSSQTIDPTTLAAGIQIVRANGDSIIGNSNDIALVAQPSNPVATKSYDYFEGIPEQTNQVVIRFLNTLPDDTYQISVTSALKNTSGQSVSNPQSLKFSLNYGAQVSAVVPQPVTRVNGVLTQAANQIQVYFTNDTLQTLPGTNNLDPSLFQLIFTGANGGTATTADDVTYNPTSVVYDSTSNMATLTFSKALDQLGSGTGTFRLRIGDDAVNGGTSTVDVGNSSKLPSIAGFTTFSGAFPVGQLDSANTLVSNSTLLTNAQIAAPDPNNPDDPLRDPLLYPGGVTDPGQQNQPAPTSSDTPMTGQIPAIDTIDDSNHFYSSPNIDPSSGVSPQATFGPDSAASGITTLYYNFRAIYGTDPLGNPLINQITAQQEQDVRDIFTLWGHYLGVQFVETATQGLTIATGDTRAVASYIPVTSLNGIEGLSQITGDDNTVTTIPVAIVSNLTDWGASEYGGAYFQQAMQQIGHYLGLNQSNDLPGLQVMGSSGAATDTSGNPITNTPEPVLPGNFDIMDGQYLYRPDGSDINVYSFSLEHSGTFSAETIAQRAPVSSLLNTVLTLYDSSGNMIARNDDYFGSDSYINVPLQSGQYYIVVTSTGNTDFNPNVPLSGNGGTTQGFYDLRLSFNPIPPDKQLTDIGGQALDGDLDGIAGGDFNFWFQVGDSSNTIFVDKTAAAGGNGSLTSPFNNLATALTAATSLSAGGTKEVILRIEGNGGADGNVSTLGDDVAYEIGRNSLGNPLSDGTTFNVPKGVTVMIDAGAVLKLQGANVNAGTFAQGDNRSGGAIQVLGTPHQSVYFTSDNNESIGVDTNPLHTTPLPGDWGGLVFQNDSDYEQNGVFLNYVAHADISYGGGPVNVVGQQQVYTPIDLVTSRPTILDNNIHDNGNAAISADPDSFQFSLVEGNSAAQGGTFIADYNRAGPLVHGNVLARDSINGLFIRIRVNAGEPIDVLDVTAQLASTDIVYVLSQNLEVQGETGGNVALDANGQVTDTTLADADGQARLSAGGGVGNLVVDPGVIVKSNNSRIEVGMGAQLIAEGTSAKPIIFTSLFDDTYGAGGVFATTGNFSSIGNAGDWSGFFFNPISTGSFDHVEITDAGGMSSIEGGFADFNAVEIYQATVRIADSVIENNAGGADSTNRNGRGSNAAAAIYVIGAQPVIVNNIIRNNKGDAISINANSLNAENVPDWGRSTGTLGRFTQFDDNYGPLVRLNVLQGNDMNAMEVRGATLDTQSIWDDTDITHVLLSNIDIPNFESVGGLELKSSPTQSLVVKLAGQTAGFTAGGQPLDISNRIGGTLQILGTPGHPVVLTSLGDNTVGAGVDLSGNPVLVTVPPTPSLNIQFEFDSTVPTAARAALQQAAAAWAAVIHTPVTITIDVSFAHGLPTDVLGDTLPVFASLDYDQVRSAMIANEQSDDQFLSLLPTFSQLQTTFPDNTYTLNSSMQVARSEALALGFSPNVLPTQVSKVDGKTPVDATMEFSLDFPFDFTNSDGTTAGDVDFTAVATHEIGHALGFDSAVDDIVGGVKQVSMTPLDMFRLAPGQGATNFTNAPRLLESTAVGTQVFYDGGEFDNPSLMVPGSTAGDIPLSTGTDFQASHWEYRGDLSSTTPIGIMDPVILNGEHIQQTDIRAMELLGWNTSSTAGAGAWQGITLTQYANDRNVALVNELEPSYTGSTGDTNGAITTAQSLGSLAPDQLNGDENLRLGFTVNGSISYDNPADQDIYSFQGTAGTEVWMQISNTTSSLDTVLQLVQVASDGSTTVVAQSDNAYAELTTPGLMQQENLAINPNAYSTSTTTYAPNPQPLALGNFSGGVPSLANDFQPDPTGVNAELYSKNQMDAGMRVTLPGTAGQTFAYYVRVLSKNGQTSGQYTLQIRLQEQPEVAGSTVQFADIRNATTAINVQGLPDSSPLTSTSTQVFNPSLVNGISNDTFNGAQDLGNLLTSDQNIISVSSQLVNAAQVQWYKFTLDYADVQAIEGGTDANQSWATMFDIDYAGGTARPDLTLSVFDALGNLIYISRNSNDVGDQPTPTASAQSNLSTGSSSPLDPFLGTVQLPVGASKTYYVAISSDAELPTDLSQTFLPAANSPEAIANPSLPTVPLALSLERMEPVDSVTRIVEDHIDPTVPAGSGALSQLPLNPGGGYTTSDGSTINPTTTSILPIAPAFINNPNPNQPSSVVNALAANVVSYGLGDVPLLIAAENDNAVPTQLFSVNAATGAINNNGNPIGRIPSVSGGNIAATSTITMRSDGLLFGDQTILTPNANGGDTVLIDPSNALAYVDGPDNIAAGQIPQFSPTTPPPPPKVPNNAVTTDPTQAVGGMTFIDTGVGHGTIDSSDTDHYYAYYAVTDNFGVSHLYLVNPTNGTATGNTIFNPVPLNGAGTYGPNDGTMYMDPTKLNYVPFSGNEYVTNSDVGTVTGLATVQQQGVIIQFPPASQIDDGAVFSISDSSHTDKFEFIFTQGENTGTNIPILISPTDDAATVATKVKGVLDSLVPSKTNINPNNLNIATEQDGAFLTVIGAFGVNGGTAPINTFGLPEGGQAVYGVTASGQFISINTEFDSIFFNGNPPQGIVKSISTLGINVQFAGLCAPPQDLDINGDGFGGDLSNILFAITTTGDIYAIDTTLNNGAGGIVTSVPSKVGGATVNLWPNGANHLSTGIHNVQGLAFSPVDVNLWHPTTLGATDPGHGINAAPDNSRDLGTNLPGTNNTDVAGGASYYFGLEDYESNSPATAPFHYLSYPTLTQFDSPTSLITGALPGTPNAQYGFNLSNEQQALTAYNAGEWPIPAEVTRNSLQHLLIGNNDSAPGGAHGDLITDSFSLDGYSANDVPTLYFNYLLSAGWNQSTESGADIAKVSVSTDGGATWKVVASNQSSDMAQYQSVFSNTGSGNPLQGNQFLFNAPLVNPADPTQGIIDTWRQARIDLSQFAGDSNIKLKFTYVATGANDQAYLANGGNNSAGIQAGLAIDDIEVGLAGRGEMVTQDPNTLNKSTDPTTLNSITTFFTVPQPPSGSATQSLVGAYELSIRRGQEYATTQFGISNAIAVDPTKLLLGSDRSETNYSMLAPGMVEMDLDSLIIPAFSFSLYENPAANLSAPATFSISDGFGNSKTFEFDSETLPIDTSNPLDPIIDYIPNGVASGNVGIPFFSLNQDALVPLTQVQLNQLNQTIVNTINAQTSNSFRVRAVLDPSGKIFLIPTTSQTAQVSVDVSNSVGLLNTSPQIVAGDTFTLSDGVYSRTFEYVLKGGTVTTNGQLLPDGNHAVLFTTADSPNTVATNILKAINSQTSSLFGVSASIQGWNGTGPQPNGPPTSNQINLFGAQVLSNGVPGITVLKYDNRGDVNPVRAQGELIIANNDIRNASNYGINVTPAVRDATDAQQQSAANLLTLNNSVNQKSVAVPQGPLFPGSKNFTFGLGLVPGVVIENNIIDSAGTAGINFTGDADTDSQGNIIPTAVVAFGKIVNNTIYGGGSGVGIAVSKNSSPTLLNNILANLSIGVIVDPSSSTTVLGSNLYQGNTQNTVGTGLGFSAATPSAAAPLFVNPTQHNFNLLESNSSGLPNLAIDSSTQTLADRPAMTAVDSPVGIGVVNGVVVGFPIIAPATDETGKLRIADPNVQSSGGSSGSNIFIDRGALDRSDFTAPTAALFNPADNGATDQDPTLNSVLYGGGPLPNFQIQLSDGTGSGVDDSTVSTASFAVYMDVPAGQNPANFPQDLLTDGNQYVFTYDAVNHIARFTPTIGSWASGHSYTIVVANSGPNAIKDLSANPLNPNSDSGNTAGLTIFQVSIQSMNFGTAPAPYPTTLAQNGARNIVNGDGLFLGSSESSSADGQPNVNAGNGQLGNGVVFGTLVPGTVGSVVVTASKSGGNLNAWIDWKGDGSWADAGDQFVFYNNPQLTGTPVTTLNAGAQTLYFAVPVTNITTTYARFRLSSESGLSYTGLGQDGEVEDYKVAIQPTTAYTVVLADPSSGKPLPIVNGNYVVLPGASFVAQVYVNDTRAVGATGVTQAFADLTHDNSLVSWVANSLVIAFPNGQSGTPNAGGQTDIDEAGGSLSGAPSSPGTPELLFSVTGTVSASALPNGTIVNFATAPATGAGHTTLISGTSTPVVATYGQASLIIPKGIWQNPNSLFQEDATDVWSPDINNDGFVNLKDIVNLITTYNSIGQVGLFGPTYPIAFPTSTGPYIDVNGDGFFNLGDIVAEVSYYNQFGPSVAPNQTVVTGQQAHFAMAPASQPTGSQETMASQQVTAVQQVSASQAVAPSQTTTTQQPVVVAQATAAPAVTTVATSSVQSSIVSMSSTVASSMSAPAAQAAAADSVFASDSFADPISANTEWSTGSVAQASVAARSVSTTASSGSGSDSSAVSAAVARSQVFAEHSQSVSLLDGDDDDSDLTFGSLGSDN
ncbi:MAG TPA: NF038122 family metalloprotease [Pirellulales bacterium]|nr:NF038122 family metalloprotease [Pirellulales bacterium]